MPLIAMALVSIACGQDSNLFVDDKAPDKIESIKAAFSSSVPELEAPESTPKEKVEFSTPQNEQPLKVASWEEIEQMFKGLEQRVSRLEIALSGFESRLQALESGRTNLSFSQPVTGFATSWGSAPTQTVSSGGCTGNYRPVQTSRVSQLRSTSFVASSNYNGYMLGAGETLVAVNGVPVSSGNPMPAYNIAPVSTQSFVGNPQRSITRTRNVRVPMQAVTTSQTVLKPVQTSSKVRLGSRLGSRLRGNGCIDGSCQLNGR